MSSSLSDNSTSSSFQLEQTFTSNKSTIYLIHNHTDSKKYILKTITHQDHFSHLAFLREKYFHSSLQHENIIQYIPENLFNFSIPNHDFISMEYACFGDFFNLVTDYNLSDEKLVRTFFHQMIKGLQYLHSHGIAHLDLKLENFLLGQDFLLKIADFDLSQKFEEAELLSKGTANYRSTEVKSGHCRDFFAADVYSLGICLYTLLAGAFPFIEENNNPKAMPFRYEMFLNDNAGFWEENQLLMDDRIIFSSSFKDLLNKMWANSPNERPTLESIEGSEWFKQPVYTKNELQMIMKNILAQ